MCFPLHFDTNDKFLKYISWDVLFTILVHLQFTLTMISVPYRNAGFHTTICAAMGDFLRAPGISTNGFPGVPPLPGRISGSGTSLLRRSSATSWNTSKNKSFVNPACLTDWAPNCHSHFPRSFCCNSWFSCTMITKPQIFVRTKWKWMQITLYSPYKFSSL